MQARQFRQMTSIERKAKFIQALISKTDGKLGRDELEVVANHRWQLGYRYQDGLSEDFDLVERQMTIIVHEDAKSFAQAATLRDVGVEHSWAGKDKLEDYGNWIVGGGEFGIHKDVTYSNNGDCGSPDVEDEDPDFNLDQTQVIVVKSVNHNSLNRASLHEEEWKLHILLKGSDFVIDPVISEIIKQFGL